MICETGRIGYFFVYEETVRIAFLVNKACEGKGRGGVTDKNGVKVIQVLRDAAKSGGGFVYYIRPRPGAGNQPKIFYAEMIPGTDT